VAEHCGGTPGSSCPADGFKPVTEACDDGNACTQTDRCSGTSANVCVGMNYAWTGVLQPINVDGSSIFTRKQGSTIPVKFKLTGPCAGSLTFKIFLAMVSNGVLGTEAEATSTSAADTGNTFRYDAANDQYIFNLATKPLSTGTWQIRIAEYQGTTELVTLGAVNISLK
jgi:hypothetical protein